MKYPLHIGQGYFFEKRYECKQRSNTPAGRRQTRPRWLHQEVRKPLRHCSHPQQPYWTKRHRGRIEGHRGWIQRLRGWIQGHEREHSGTQRVDHHYLKGQRIQAYKLLSIQANIYELYIHHLLTQLVKHGPPDNFVSTGDHNLVRKFLKRVWSPVGAKLLRGWHMFDQLCHTINR
jgi:hypothetical protein